MVRLFARKYPLRYARPPNLGGQYFILYSSPKLGEVAESLRGRAIGVRVLKFVPANGYTNLIKSRSDDSSAPVALYSFAYFF